MNVGSLFSGIGGIDLGLERAGMRIQWQCEADPWCRRVLRKHWPGVPLYEDVQALASPERVDVLAGGFPCQDVSVVGRRAGIGGEQSGLWVEYARLIRELRPRFVFVENVPGLLVRGMGRVLSDLAACGYDAEWDCLPAAAFGAPHLRARVFLLAYAERDGLERILEAGSAARATLRGGSSWWAVEPDVGRVADGVPARVDRLRGLGNAVVPQVAEWIGRRIMSAERPISELPAEAFGTYVKVEDLRKLALFEKRGGVAV